VRQVRASETSSHKITVIQVRQLIQYDTGEEVRATKYETSESKACSSERNKPDFYTLLGLKIGVNST